MPETRPRFATLLKQAKEQCKKNKYLSTDDIAVKFFASGMEYRLSHSHLEFERLFSSINNEADFLMGYLQGKGADADMIKALEEGRSHLDLIRYFREGILYEEFILEPEKSHHLD